MLPTPSQLSREWCEGVACLRPRQGERERGGREGGREGGGERVGHLWRDKWTALSGPLSTLKERGEATR